MDEIEVVDLASLALPEGIHVQALTATDVTNHEPLREVVVWADRTFSNCPACGEPVSIEVDCPVYLAGGWEGGLVEQLDQKHQCGLWLEVTSRELGRSPSEQQILAAARELAEERDGEIALRRSAVRGRLRRDLAIVVAALPLDEDREADAIAETATGIGSDSEPGIFRDSDELVAWDYDPVGLDEEGITVRARDL